MIEPPEVVLSKSAVSFAAAKHWSAPVEVIVPLAVTVPATVVVPEQGASFTSAVLRGKAEVGSLLSFRSVAFRCWSWFVIVTLLGLRCLGGLLIWERWVSGPEDSRSFGGYPRWAITVDDSKRRPTCSLLLGLVTSGLKQ